VLTDSLPLETFLLNLQYAYRISKPFVSNGVLYIPGTRRWRDVIDDIILPFDVHSTLAYAEAARLVDPTVKYIVGHSLGGAVASTLGKDTGILSVSFGSPIASDVAYADPWDPVAFLAPSEPLQNLGFLHHSVSDYIHP